MLMCPLWSVNLDLGDLRIDYDEWMRCDEKRQKLEYREEYG